VLLAEAQHHEPVGLEHGVLDPVIALGPRAVVMIAAESRPICSVRMTPC
jgi:hypothetical protein